MKRLCCTLNPLKCWGDDLLTEASNELVACDTPIGVCGDHAAPRSLLLCEKHFLEYQVRVELQRDREKDRRGYK